MQRFQVAIVGAGPAGLSAAAHAAKLGVSHVLLEASAVHAHTIQRYQKGKHVMAEPSVLPLRSELDFAAGVREEVLGRWQKNIQALGINVQYGATVESISGREPAFTLRLKSGETIAAERVVFAIGLQGNLRQLGVAGDDLPCVQYQLDDPDEYRDEVIVVVGAGDAAIENAAALVGQNKVIIVNRSDEFSRVKDGNLRLITQAIEQERISCFFRSSVSRVEPVAGSERPYVLVLDTATGEARIPCDRIIARIGAIPPRRFVEACGIEFSGSDAAALPRLSTRYESSVAGLYVIGALGGYPLIKQAMNQGYEAVEYALGRSVEPADQPLLADKFRALPQAMAVDANLQWMQQCVALYQEINPLQFREFILGSTVHVLKAGATIFRRNDYTDTFFAILDGSVEIELGEERSFSLKLGPGQFFGEMSLLSGRRRSGTAIAGPGCILIESPRREVLKLIQSVDGVRRIIDEHFIIRAIQTSFAPDASEEELRPIAAGARLNNFKPDESVFSEGDNADDLHLIRSGSVAVTRSVGGRQVVISYVAAGNYVGEMGLLGDTVRNATVRATVATETISLGADGFHRLLERDPLLAAQVRDKMRKRLTDTTRMSTQPQAGDMISFLMQQGLGEATDVLLIDQELCVGCDNCEKACAETHGGTSRLDREAGPTYAQVHVPTSCRHCEDPHCMTDCPPDAIRRAPNGEVYIRDNCIGCGNCERNCPYDVIQMAAEAAPKPGLLSWMLLGRGPGPGAAASAQPKDSTAAKRAVKCDMCKDLSGGPACVRACPTGAAIRIGPDGFIDLVHEAGR